jgi:hypothetical protein
MNMNYRDKYLMGHVALTGDISNAFKIVVRKYEVRRALARQRRRWEDNIKKDLKYVRYLDQIWAS